MQHYGPPLGESLHNGSLDSSYSPTAATSQRIHPRARTTVGTCTRPTRDNITPLTAHNFRFSLSFCQKHRYPQPLTTILAAVATRIASPSRPAPFSSRLRAQSAASSQMAPRGFSPALAPSDRSNRSHFNRQKATLSRNRRSSRLRHAAPPPMRNKRRVFHNEKHQQVSLGTRKRAAPL